MDNYLKIIKLMGTKLRQKRKILKHEAQEEKEKNINLFRINWEVYKRSSLIVKKLIRPLIKALRQNYKVIFAVARSENKRRGYLNASWKIIISHHHFEITLPNTLPNGENYLVVERWTGGGTPANKRIIVKPITEDNLQVAIKKAFLDYINRRLL